MKTFRIMYKDSSVQIVTAKSIPQIKEPIKWVLVGCIEEIQDSEVSSTPLINSVFTFSRMSSGKLWLHNSLSGLSRDVTDDDLLNKIDNHITHLECHVDGLNRHISALEQQVSGLLRDQPKSARLMQLRELCGHIKNGTDTKIVIFQDDATRTWHVKVGSSVATTKTYTGETLPLAIQEAYTKHPK